MSDSDNSDLSEEDKRFLESDLAKDLLASPRFRHVFDKKRSAEIARAAIYGRTIDEQQTLDEIENAAAKNAKQELKLGDTMEPMADKVKGDIAASVKTFESQAEPDANRSPAMLEFFERMERYRGHVQWVGAPLRLWWVVVSVFGVPYGGGLAAMFADQWLIAIALFLAASAVLAVKGIVEAKDRERAVLVLILASLFFLAHFGWVVYTHKQFLEKTRTATPTRPDAP